MAKTITYLRIIYPTGKRFDSHDVYFRVNGEKEDRGYGYEPKDRPKHYALIRCPACGRENYAMNVSSGLCTWCPFDANNPMITITIKRKEDGRE